MPTSWMLRLSRIIASRCGSYKGKAEVGTVPSMEKVYHALIAGTVHPDDEGVRLTLASSRCVAPRTLELWRHNVPNSYLGGCAERPAVDAFVTTVHLESMRAVVVRGT